MIQNMQSHLRIVTLFAASLLLAACNGAAPDTGRAMQNPDGNTLTVYHDPSCGCCTQWIEHMENNGFNVRNISTARMAGVKERLKVPDHLMSCHTAIIGDYVIEGHVPAADVKRLLEQHPRVTGLSVPGMPVGSPGMEYRNRHQAYSVLMFNDSGRTVAFNQYPGQL